MRYGQTISEEGMGGKTTEAGGSANQGKRGHVVLCNDSKDVEVCSQTDLGQQIHRGEQKTLKNRGGTRVMGPALVLDHRIFGQKV